jgi:predicted nucleic acid-binding protein
VSRYLLDTDVLISFAKNKEPALSFVKRAIATGDELGVSPVVVTEFYAGLAARDYPTWDAFFANLEYWTVSNAAARQAGAWRYQFARQGTRLSTTDLLTAAVAVERDAILVTSNVKDFPMEELELLPLKQ